MVRHACGVALLDCYGLRDCAALVDCAGLLDCATLCRRPGARPLPSFADVAGFGIGKGWAGG